MNGMSAFPVDIV